MSLDPLIACAGRWTGSSTLQDPEMGLQPDTSDSTVTITPLLDGRFVRLDYTWSYKGTPQSGSMLIGFRKASRSPTLHWIDSWHNGENVMSCEGTANGSAIDVRGTYAAPPGPDWGWRTAISTSPDGELAIVMHNVTPDGQETLAVEGRYRRV